MTFAPQELLDLAELWKSHAGQVAGIVGDEAHRLRKKSYHLGRSELSATAYSRKTARDKAGLSEAASAIDLGILNGSRENLRQFSEWLVEQCQANVPGTSDIREVIYAPPGSKTAVLHYDRELGISSQPFRDDANDSHLGHTHVSYYRDSEARDKTGVFGRFWLPTPPPPPPEKDMPGLRITTPEGPNGEAIRPITGRLDLKKGDAARLLHNSAVVTMPQHVNSRPAVIRLRGSNQVFEFEMLDPEDGRPAMAVTSSGTFTAD